MNHLENGIFRRAATEVAPSEDVSVGCHKDVPGNEVGGGELRIVLRYRPSWVFWKSDKDFRFHLHAGKDGSFQWVPKAMQSETERTVESPDPFFPDPSPN